MASERASCANDDADTRSLLDHAHGMLPPKTDGSKWPSTRLRLLYDLLTAPQLQNGLGITPGEGDWERVKGIVALHDDAADNAWVERWATADWKVGLLAGLSSSDQDILARNVSSLETQWTTS